MVVSTEGRHAAPVHAAVDAAGASAGRSGGVLSGVLDASEEWEGQAGARTYWFAAREVGAALAAVAGGASYRAASEQARRQADRVSRAGEAQERTPPGCRARWAPREQVLAGSELGDRLSELVGPRAPATDPLITSRAAFASALAHLADVDQAASE
jgi:hypothetical protein